MSLGDSSSRRGRQGKLSQYAEMTVVQKSPVVFFWRALFQTGKNELRSSRRLPWKFPFRPGLRFSEAEAKAEAEGSKSTVGLWRRAIFVAGV